MKTNRNEKFLTMVSNFASKLFIMAFAAVMVASCVKGVITESAFLPETEADLERTVYVQVDALDGAALEGGNEDAVKALARATEDQSEDESVVIYDLWVLQIDPSTEGESVIAARYVDNYNEPGDKIVRLYPYENGKTCDIVYVANTADNQLFSRGMTREEVYSVTYEATSEQALFASAHSDDTNGNVFIMSQINAGIEIKVNDDTHNVEALKSTLRRNVAKIEFSVSYDTTDSGLIWSTAAICNVPIVSSYSARVSSHEGDGAYFTSFPADLDYRDLTSYSDTFESGSGDGTVNKFYYYVPVNMRGIETKAALQASLADTAYSEFATDPNSYKYYDWSLKAAAAKAAGNEGIGLATYFKLVGTIDDAVHDASGAEYDVVFQEYIGTDALSYNVLPNNYYVYTLKTTDVDSYTLMQDARFSVEEAASAAQMYDINVLQANRNIAAYGSYTPDVSISKAGTVDSGEYYAKEDTDIYTLAVFYVASDGEILGKKLINDYAQYDGSTNKAQIELVPGSHTSGGHMLYIANVNAPETIFSGVTARSYNAELEVTGYGDNVTKIYNMTANAVSTALESALFTSTSGNVNRVVMSGIANDAPITRSTTLTQPTFYRNIARMSYTISNTNAASELTWSNIQVNNVPRVYGYATFHGNLNSDWTTFPTAPQVASYASYSFSTEELAKINTDAGLTIYYYLPVNKRSVSTLGTSSWAAKYSAVLLDETYKNNATYITMSGYYIDQVGDDDNELEYDISHTNYLGATSNDLNILANNYYAYSLNTTASAISQFDADARFEYDVAVATERDFPITIDESAPRVLDWTVVDARESSYKAVGALDEPAEAKITTLAVFHVNTTASGEDRVLAKKLINNYMLEDANTIRLLTGSTSKNGYFIYIANAPAPETLFASIAANNLNTNGTLVSEIYAKVSDAITASTTNNMFYTASSTPQYVMSALVKHNISSAEILQEPEFVRNVAKVSYIIKNENVSNAELFWNSIQLYNVANRTTYAAYQAAGDSETYVAPGASYINYNATTFSDDDMTAINATDGFTVTYYVPVNMLGTDSDLESSSWGAKYTKYASAATGRTYVEMKGYQYADKTGTNMDYDVTFTNFLGASASDFNLTANSHYQYSMYTSNGALLSAVATTGDESRYAIAEQKTAVEYTLPASGHTITGRKLVTVNASGSTTTGTESNITGVTTSGEYISSLHTYYIDADGTIQAVSTDKTKITITPGTHRGGYLLFIANAINSVAVGKTYDDLAANVLSSSATSNGAYIRNSDLDVMTATYTININTSTDLSEIPLAFTRNNAKVTYNLENSNAAGTRPTELIWSSIRIKNAPTVSYSLAALLVDSSTVTFPTDNNRIDLDQVEIGDDEMTAVNNKTYSVDFYVPVNLQPSVSYSSWANKYLGTIADEDKSAVATYVEAFASYTDYLGIEHVEDVEGVVTTQGERTFSLTFNNFLGSSASDFRLEPNTHYTYTLATTVTDSYEGYGGITGNDESGYSFGGDARFVVDYTA
ncbi:MAG: hypothetical protein SNG55_07000, partial [Rikenellaceae bacterium]